jgi:diacylglycerol kinase family enzyme
MSGGTHRISLGKMTHEDEESRYFILMAGAGFDGDVVYSVNPKVKKVLGKGAYVLKGMKLLGKYHPEPITVKTNGAESIGYTVIVGNAGCYAGRFRMTPNASLFSPYFYVFVIKRSSRFSIVRTFFKLLNASHIHAKDVSYFRTQSLRLEGSSHIQVDGDCSGQLPVEISIERECLNILH